MTSKNLSFLKDLIKQRLKRWNWLIALASTVFFFSIPVAGTRIAQELDRYAIRMREQLNFDPATLEAYLRENVNMLFTIQNNPILVAITVPAAIILAAVVFSYLNSKTQVDFYHSQPVSRDAWFITNFICGVLIYILPYVACMLLGIAVYALFGFGGYLSIGFIAAGFLKTLLCFLVIYLIAMAAFLLCGNTVVGMLGIGVFFVYLPALAGLGYAYMETFYQTFYGGMINMDEIVTGLSPVADFTRVMNFSVGRILCYCGLVILLFFACLLLSRHRKSESAGKAIAFRTAKPAIKFPLAFLFTAALGLMFYHIGNQQPGWMLFGFLCGVVLSHAIIQVIYEFDFGAVKTNLKPMLAFMAVFALVVSVPAFDLTGYDEKLPTPGAVRSVSINISEMRQNSYCQIPYYMRNGETYDQVLHQRLRLSDPASVEAAIKIAGLGVAYQQQGAEDGLLAENRKTSSVGMGFHYTNGSDLYRYYSFVPADALRPHLFAIYNTQEFKEKFFDMIYLRAAGFSLNEVYCQNLMTAGSQPVNDPAKMEALCAAVSRDILKLTAEYLSENLPVFIIEAYGQSDSRSGVSMRLPVYEASAETLTLLSQYGIDPFERVPMDQIDAIEIEWYGFHRAYYDTYAVDYYEKYGSPMAVAADTSEVLRITDKEDIKAVLAAAVPELSISNALFFEGAEREYGIRVISSEYRNGYNETYLFLAGQLPQFVSDYYRID